MDAITHKFAADDLINFLYARFRLLLHEPTVHILPTQNSAFKFKFLVII